jgi:hypothetical protein
MTTDVETALANLLRGGAPNERDPLFRVAVLERLERARFKQRRRALLTLALALGVIASFGLMGGGAARDAAGVLLIGAALMTVYFVLLPAAAQALARGRA